MEESTLKRIGVIAAHVSNGSPLHLSGDALSRHETSGELNIQHENRGAKAGDSDSRPFDYIGNLIRNGKFEKFIAELDSLLPKAGEYNVADHLVGPLRDKERYPGGWIDAFLDLNKESKLGRVHVKIAEWQKRYGTLSSNIVIPFLIYMRSSGDEGLRLPPVVAQEVIIANPDDAQRIARLHVKKQPNFNLFFYGSIISTLDNDHWRMQRQQLLNAFLPQASLRQIFDISAKRAAHCAERMGSLLNKANEENSFVDVNEFMLHETQAQLQLALFGESNEFMEETNQKFRHSMGGAYDSRYVRSFCRRLLDRMSTGENQPAGTKEDVQNGRCPVAKGPLSFELSKMDADRYTAEGNALIFAFAGHDTTGHTMTWLMFELAKNPKIQQRLRNECIAFYDELNGRKPEYEDLAKLTFLTKCIMETLRLWPAVANGTFREIQFDDYISGPDGDVLLKKGQFVRIVNWSRHRNPELWGKEAEIFNPDREWKVDEIWNGEGLRGYNPATSRFSPFTFPPRGCIGMNFAHMEMRLIIVNLLINFEFSLTDEFKKHMKADKYLGVNYGTLGPAFSPLSSPPLTEGYAGWAPQRKVQLGLPMIVKKIS